MACQLLWFVSSFFCSVKRRTKDIDQIQDELKAIAEGRLAIEKFESEDVTGGGQFFCVPCSRHFINEQVLREHEKSKPHKKRVKLVKEPQYTQKEADMAAGMSYS